MTYVALLLALGYFGIERWFPDRAAASIEGADADQGASPQVAGSLMLTIGVTLLLWLLDIGATRSRTLPAIGVSIMAVALVLRIWAMRTLRRSQSRTLAKDKEKALVTRGPYRIIRHPGYLATMAFWIAFALALSNAAAAIVAVVVLVPAYARRIEAEESALLRVFGMRYDEYRRRTSRLVPPLY